MSFVDFLRSLLGVSRSAGTSPFDIGAGPARLLVMRHAEKTGDKHDPHLSAEGARRAETLAIYIPERFGRPDFLVAAAESEKSNRPYETLEPLAKALNLSILEDFDDDEIRKLIAELARPNYNGKFGVIAWRHSELPALLAALGAPPASFPDPWDPDCFNLIIDVTFANPAPPVAHQIPSPF